MPSRIVDLIKKWANWLWCRISATTDSGDGDKPVPPNNDVSSQPEGVGQDRIEPYSDGPEKPLDENQRTENKNEQASGDGKTPQSSPASNKQSGLPATDTDSGKPVPPNNDISSQPEDVEQNRIESCSDGHEKQPDEDQRTEDKIERASGDGITSQSSPASNKQSGLSATDEDDSDSYDHEKPELAGNDKPVGRQSKPPREIPARRGRERGTSSRKEKGEPKKSSPGPRAQLICIEKEQRWGLYLSADEECPIAKVRQGNEPLASAGGEWSILSFRGSLSITYEDGERHEIELFNDRPLVFKFQGGWQGTGHKVKYITSGHFIVIVPQEWHRRGNVPVEQDGCTDSGFIAHYFSRGREDSSEDAGGFGEYAGPLTKSSFTLIGNRIFDNSDEGELFGGPVLELNLASEVEWVRVGEERDGGWPGDNFKPDKPLAEVLNGRQGRFFVRVYDDDTKRLDSDEFRYFANLQKILVDGAPYSETSLLIPSSTGHSPTEVQLIGTEDSLILPKLETDEAWTTVRPDGTVVVKPHPDGDHVSCKLESDKGSVRVEIKLPRIWWRLSQRGEQSEDWHSVPFEVTRQGFRDRAERDEAIWLRLPLRIASVKAGFDEETDRKYRSDKKGEDVEIPLLDFLDYRQIDQRLNADTSLNIEIGEQVLALIQVSSDPVPTILSFACEPEAINEGDVATLSWETQDTEPEGVTIEPEIGSVKPNGSRTVSPNETTTYTLRLTAANMDDVTKDATVTIHREAPHGTPPEAMVKCRSGWRRGKGFSRRELRAAGLAPENDARGFIPVDRRRRSMHPDNVATLRRLTDA